MKNIDKSLLDDYRRRRAVVIRKLKVLSQNKVFGEGAKGDIDYLLRRLPPTSKVETTKELRLAMRELEIAEHSNRYSVRGRQRTAAKTITTLRGYGLKIRTYDELNSFTEFMEHMREYSVGRIYDSTKAADIWNENRGSTIYELENKYKEWERQKRK